MNNWRKCELSAENCGLVDGIWYILEVQGAKRPLLGQWDEENARFVGSGLVGRDLDEAIEVKSGKNLYFMECPRREDVIIGVDLSQKGPITTYVSEDDIWNGLEGKKYWETFIPREDVDDWRLK